MADPSPCTGTFNPTNPTPILGEENSTSQPTLRPINSRSSTRGLTPSPHTPHAVTNSHPPLRPTGPRGGRREPSDTQAPSPMHWSVRRRGPPGDRERYTPAPPMDRLRASKSPTRDRPTPACRTSRLRPGMRGGPRRERVPRQSGRRSRPTQSHPGLPGRRSDKRGVGNTGRCLPSERADPVRRGASASGPSRTTPVTLKRSARA